MSEQKKSTCKSEKCKSIVAKGLLNVPNNTQMTSPDYPYNSDINLGSRVIHTINAPAESIVRSQTLDTEEMQHKFKFDPPYTESIQQKLPIPLQDRVLVSKTKPEQISKGGIIIPETAIQDHKTGIVVALGPTVNFKTVQEQENIKGEIENKSILVPGNMIQFGEYAGVEVEYNGETYLIMKEADILCILP